VPSHFVQNSDDAPYVLIMIDHTLSSADHRNISHIHHDNFGSGDRPDQDNVTPSYHRIMAANLVPGEILAQIFAVEGTICGDLKSYALVNSKWRTEAQYELFRTSIFAIRYLDSPPQFISFSKLVENEEYAYLGSVVGQLRIGLTSLSPVDPQFHGFLDSLTRIHTIYFENDIGSLLSERVLSPELRHSLIHLLHSTSLIRVIINADEFPLWILRSCLHVKSLTVTFPSHYISENDPLNDGNSCSHNIEELNFSGDGYALHSFVVWLRKFYVVAVDKIQRAIFTIPIMRPAFERDIFLGYVSLSHLTFKTTVGKYVRSRSVLVLNFAIVGTESRYDLSPLINLTTLNIETEVGDMAAQQYAARRLNVVSGLSWWARSFIITLPVPSKLQAFRVSLSGTYATNRDFMEIPEGDAAYHFGILRGALINICPSLLTLSFHLSCLFLNQEDIERIFSQLVHTDVSVHGPAG
jgi:hypothetical protein